ncbi:MAG: DUF6502 family protein [Steroidobacteraceae bacterium]
MQPKKPKRNARAKRPSPGASRRRARGATPVDTASAPGAANHSLRPLDLALDVLLAGTIEFLLEFGLTKEEIAEKLRHKAHTLAETGEFRAQTTSSHLEMMRQVSSILHDWWRDSEYVTGDGKPRPLPLHGPGLSLAKLIERRFPRAEVDRVIEWMERAGIFTRGADGRVTTAKTTNRSVIVGGRGALTTERAAMLSAQVLGTVVHNGRVDDHADQNFDRTAHVHRLSTRHVRRFRQYVNVQGEEFLELVDNWLEDHQAVDGEDSVEAGVHAYVYVHEPRRRGDKS